MGTDADADSDPRAAGRVPLTVVTGFLGVGKTTTLLHLARQRPPQERWLVLVNEVGQVGIDGALLADDPTLTVQEIAGGCLCCASDAPFQITLQRALDALRPDRILLEPTGLAETGRVLDILQAPPFRDQVDRRATLTLLDPRHLRQPDITRRAAWQSQVQAADVLIANRCDRASPDDLRSFFAFAADLFPPRRQILATRHGQIDAALLDLDPRDPPQIRDATGRLSAQDIRRITRRPSPAGPDYATQGWVLEPSLVLDASALTRFLSGIQSSEGILRIKGIFHTSEGWRSVQADVDGVRWAASAWRTDSRLEIIAHPQRLPDPVALEEALRAAACIGDVLRDARGG